MWLLLKGPTGHLRSHGQHVNNFKSQEGKEGNAGHIWQKCPKMALISEYFAEDLSADASADALCIINIG